MNHHSFDDLLHGSNQNREHWMCVYSLNIFYFPLGLWEKCTWWNLTYFKSRIESYSCRFFFLLVAYFHCLWIATLTKKKQQMYSRMFYMQWGIKLRIYIESLLSFFSQFTFFFCCLLWIKMKYYKWFWTNEKYCIKHNNKC